MYPRIEVERQIDELNKEIFTFVLFDDLKLTLDDYYLQQRESKRHKFKSIKYYDRRTQRNSNISVDDVPLTDEISKQAIDKIIAQLRVVK